MQGIKAPNGEQKQRGYSAEEKSRFVEFVHAARLLRFSGCPAI
jgi:hypothetical protein